MYEALQHSQSLKMIQIHDNQGNSTPLVKLDVYHIEVLMQYLLAERQRLISNESNIPMFFKHQAV